MRNRERLLFADRADAARRLAAALARYDGDNPLVLAIPRGGVPIARVVAAALHGEFDVVLVRKLGAPGNPEFAVGAIDESGNVQLADYARRAGATPAYVEREAARQLAVIRERRASYSPLRAPLDPAGRTVIVVDDGLATGATMRAALSAARARGPKHLVCAVPVGARESVASLAGAADEIVCLSSPDDFHAVGEFYIDFSAVDDDEVVALLAAPAADAAPLAANVQLAAGSARIDGDLVIPSGARGVVLFAHGSGSSRRSPRNRFVAAALNRVGLATLLFDLLTPAEDADRASRFDIGLLAERLDAAVRWARHDARTAALPLGLFGASTGAAAALAVAAQRGDVRAVVSRGGRPDLAGAAALARVAAPTLLIVGGDDPAVLDLNRAAARAMRAAVELRVVPGATHLFEEPGTLEQVADLAARWFLERLSAR